MKNDLTKKEIIKRGCEYPKELFNLKYTNHVIERLNKRCIGLDCIPTVLRVTEENLFSGRPDVNNRLTSVVVKLKYHGTRYLYLCCNPYDGGLKTIWFRDDKSTRVKPHKFYNKQTIRVHK